MTRTLSIQFVQAHRRSQRRLGPQAGLTVLGALLALAIGATVTYGQIQGQLTKLQITDGQLEADLFNRVKDAQNTYALENYPSLQSDLPVSKNGVTLAVGNTAGQTLSPRVEDLVAMGYLVAGTTSASNKIDGGTYRVVFAKSPAGCLTTACNIVGDAYIDRPYLRTGTTEALGPSIGAFLERVGGDATVSLVSAPGVLISANQVQTANPVSGNPAGVIGARVGYGSSGFGRFLVVGDSRDPNFKGGATLAGVIASNPTVTLDVKGKSVFEGNVSLVDPATGTSCIDMLNATGTITIGCQGALIAKMGTFTGPNGVVKVGETGTINTVDTTGRINANQGFSSSNGSLFANNSTGVRTGGNGFTVQSSGGANMIAVKEDGTFGSAGSLNSQVLGLTNQVGLNTACSPTSNTAVTAASVTSLGALADGGLATCINGLWKPLVQTALPGSVCAPEGATALSSTNSSGLVCKNGVYMQFHDLLSSFVLMSQARVSDGALIEKPVCGQLGAGVGQGVPVLTGQVETSNTGLGVGSFERRVEVSGSQWLIVLKDRNGVPLTQNEGLLQSFCYY